MDISAATSNVVEALHGEQPMMDMNTTPLIDVMLVLLVMMIITIPPQSHKVGMNLPTSAPLPQPLQLVNDISLSDDGLVAWNGTRVSDGELKALLAASAAREVQPEIHFRPDATEPYARVDEVLAIASRSGVTRFGFVGNERYSDIF